MKKMISVLLTVCMVLSLFAVAAVSVGAEEGTSFYLVGTMNGWTASDGYRLEKNPDNAAEYMLKNVQLPANTELKVRSVGGGWYPDNSPNMTIYDAGIYDFYFRPDYLGDETYGWHYGTILAQRVYAVLKG
ncbi:MAG: hypothetical protein II127_02920, partial [Ruminococcus sp.]|nr:hypothetical protein [Ruminococcus sp.]